MKRTGRRLRTEHLEVRTVDSLLLYPRVAVIVGKHGHTIVERNQLRRRLKELTRTRAIPQLERVDVVIRAMPSAYEATFDELAEEVEKITGEISSEMTER